MVEIMQCGCKNEYQDKVYGKGYRVHNYARKSDSWRCTSCGQVRQGIKKKKEDTQPEKEVKKSKKGKK